MTKIVSNNEYSKMVQKASPNSPIITNCIKAFFVGGLICDLGQFFINTFKSLGCTIEQSNSYTSIILIFIASLLTGLGLYSKIGKFAGAGSIVPITGTFCLITILETSNPTNDFPFPSIPTIIPSGAASDGSLENI